MSFSKTLAGSPFPLWAKAASLHVQQIIHSTAVSDGLLFLRSWRKDPAKVGAILPSGAALSAAITCEITSANAPVLELGCGTGVFTKKIIERGVSPQQLVLVEVDPFFACNLRAKYPQAQIVCIDACRLYLMPVGLDKPVGAVICGLPLRNMSIKQQFRILQGVFGSLRINSALYLFSYGWRCPIPLRLLDRFGLRAQKLDTALLNVPPARIWKIVRHEETYLESEKAHSVKLRKANIKKDDHAAKNRMPLA